MTNLDEQALRTAMNDLLADQPPQPTDRVGAVRRRHARRRTMQIAGTALTAAIAVVAALLVGGVVGRQAAEPLDREVPSWALPWPEHRDGSVSQRVLDGVIARWRADGPKDGQRPPARIVWYVAKIVSHDQFVAVMFEADTGTDHRLVVGVTPLDQARRWHGIDGRRVPPVWRLHDVAAPPPSYRGIIGTNFGDFGAHNSVVLLAPPDVRAVRWTAPGAGSGTVGLDDGFGTIDMPPTRGPVQAAIVSPSDTGALHYEPVGVPGAPESRIGQLAEPAPLVGVGRHVLFHELTGQGVGGTSDSVPVASGTATKLYARCYGPTPIRVAVDDDRDGAGLLVPCDDRQHVLSGPRAGVGPGSWHSTGLWVIIHAAYDVAWRVAVTTDATG